MARLGPRIASAMARSGPSTGVAAPSARDRHVGAGEMEQPLEQQREPVGILGRVGEEAAPFLRAHRLFMVLEQLERAA